MTRAKTITALAAFSLLAACEARIGKDADASAAAGGSGNTATAARGAEEGTLSIDAPGLDLKIDIPKAVAERSNAQGDVIYPGSVISGMHVQADADGKGAAQSGVELRFSSSDPPQKIATWYRDSARSDAFAVGSAREEGGAFIISGVETKDRDPFTVRLSPGRNGGTDGQVTLTDRN